MPPLASIGVPVIDVAREPGNKGKIAVYPTRQPRTYDDGPLPTKLSDHAPKNARIVGRNIDDHGVAYHLKIGDFDINDIRIHEILEYVSALQLEEFENSQFAEEREVLKVLEAEKEELKQAKLERQKQRAKYKGIVAFEDVDSTNDDTEEREVASGKNGRERPTYTHLFLQPKVKRRRKRDPETGELIPLSDEEQNESSGVDLVTSTTVPSGKRGRPKKVISLADGAESASSDFQQPGLPVKKRPRRRRHPQTGELMPLGWRFNLEEEVTVDDKQQIEAGSPSFKRLRISQDHGSKCQRLDTEESISRSPSPFPTKAELAAQISQSNQNTPKTKSTLPVSEIIELQSSDDEPSAALPSFRAGTALKSPAKLRGNSFSKPRMMQSTATSSDEESSPASEPRTSMLQPSAAKAMPEPSSADQLPHAHPQPVPKTSILNPSATRASSSEPPVRPSEDDETSEPGLEDDEWFIQEILAHHLSDPKTHPAEFGNIPVMLYQVKWEGYEKPTWEPIESFGDKTLVAEYRKRNGLSPDAATDGMTIDNDQTTNPPLPIEPNPPSPPKKPQQQAVVDNDDDDDDDVELEEDEFEIEDIVGHHLSDPKTHPRELGKTPVMLYKVKWKGWKELTWEPASSFEDESILQQYRRRARLDADSDEEMTG